MAGAARALMEAAAAGDGDSVIRLLEEGADATHMDEEDGRSALMAAAQAGSEQSVTALLAAGAVWNAQDRKGRTAGEYALHAEHHELVDTILQHAVACEMILGVAKRRQREQESRREGEKSKLEVRNEAYLKQHLRYIDAGDAGQGGGDSRLMDEGEDAVMMAWETPLMEAHAEQLFADKAAGNIAILNVGFGMGIIDSAIERRKPLSHTIIEAHPDVVGRMRKDGWHDKPGVEVIEARWQDAAREGRLDDKKYDAIFFDTYGEYYEDMKEFHDLLPRLLKRGGRYSFFNGLTPDNIFFQAVYARIIELELQRLGISSEFLQVEIRGPDDDTWEGVKQEYYFGGTYYLPLCTLQEDSSPL